MPKLRFALLVAGLIALSGGGFGQEKKKDDPKADDKAAAKSKGYLPPYWKDIVSEDQKPKIYTIQSKYREQIEELEGKIADLKKKRDKELLEVLSPDQKKRLEEKIKEKAGIGK